MHLRTVGFSPKAILAFFTPFLVTVLGTLSSWIVTGDFNEAEIRTALSGVVLALMAALGAYVGNPGKVVKASP